MENRVGNGKVWNVIALWLLNIDHNVVVWMLMVDYFGHVVLFIGSLEFLGVENGFGIFFVVFDKILFFLWFEHLIIGVIELIFEGFLISSQFI